MKLHSEGTPTAQFVRQYPRWLRSFYMADGPLETGTPWLPFSAQAFLDSVVGPATSVFEFGSGGSTVFFARRAAEVVSVEHDFSWAARVREILLAEGLSNADVRVIPPAGVGAGDPADPDAYVSSDPASSTMSFSAYARAVDAWPDNTFDIGVVDGRARPSCYKHLRSKVRIGGLIVLDNSDRASYGYVREDARARGWIEQRFAGPCPYSRQFTETTVWTRTS